MRKRTSFAVLIAVCLSPLVCRTLAAASIHEAAAVGDMAAVKDMLVQHPDLLSAVDDRERTALHHAAAGGHLEIVDYLLAQGANIEASDRRDNTPLMSAINSNRLDAVKLLIQRGANASAQNTLGPAIEIAYWTECMKGTSGITAYLMSAGVPFDPNEEFGATRLNMASTFGNCDMARLVVDLGADVNKVCTQDGMTEVHFAVACGHADIVELLIEHGADLKVTDSAGYPPIWSAVNQGHSAIVRLLTERGIPPDFVDRLHGRTLLHWAALRGQADIVGILLARGVQANTVDGSGNVPLYYAGKYGHREVARLLAEAGAVPPEDHAENYGRSPLLGETLSSGQAIGWTLQGHGWAIRTANHLLLFDAIQKSFSRPTDCALANGFVTATEISDQNVYALYSSFHWPILEYVHDIEDSLRSITYVHNKQEPWRGCKHTVYVDPYEARAVGALRLHTIQPAHFNPCLGYLCEIDSLRLYCAAFPADDPAQFGKDLDSLQRAVGAIDIALVPFETSDLSQSQSLRMLLEKLRPRMVCFSDYRHRTQLHPGAADALAAYSPALMVFGPGNPGDCFRYQRNRE